MAVPALMLAAMLALSADQQPSAAHHGFDIRLPAPPAPITVQGRTLALHELHLTNFSGQALTIVALEVLDDETGAVVAVYEGHALANLLGDPRGGLAQERTVPTGGFAVAYLDLESQGSTPGALRHRVSAHGPDGVVFHMETPAVSLDDTAPPRLGPPLRGGPWAAVYQPEMPRGHRRVVHAVDGRARLPGRHAIDWIRVDDQGRHGAPDRNDLAANYSFDEPVLAVADGLVVAAHDGVADPADMRGRGAVPLQEAPGNYLVLDIGGGLYAIYEHLKLGLEVAVGDRVRQGEVIARVGFTGQASGPHLHFHVSDGPDPLRSEGRPYNLEGVQVIGSYESIEAFGRQAPWTPVEAPREGDMPGPNVVVMFPD